ncbi:hypothetical protein Tco_0920091 [Tanacetum coccineum]
MPQPMQNPEDISDPTTAMNMALDLMAKAFKFKTIPTNKNQSSLIPRNSQIAQPVQNDGNEVGQNAVQNPGVQIVGNENGLSIAQEEEAGIQSTQEEFEFMAVADAYEETERVKVNCTSEDTL